MSTLGKAMEQMSTPRTNELEKHRQDLEDAAEFPEGGWAAWCTVLGAFLIQVCSYGYTTSFGVYQDYYTEAYITNQSTSAISWIGSVNAFLYEIGGLASGRLYDRGYFYPVVWGGCLLQAFSLFMLSLAKPNQYYQVFLAQGVASGLSAGMLYVPTMAVVAQYFCKRRALIMTIVSSGVAVGSVIHPIMLNNTLSGDRSLGFANSVRASAGLVSGLMLIACCLMRTRQKPPETSVDYRKVAKGCATDVAFVFGTLSLTIFDIAYYYPLFYIQLDAVSHDLDSTFSFYSLVILNAASFVGQIVAGLLADTFGVPNVLVLATFGGTILIFGMIAISTIPGFVVFAIIYGVFSGMFLAMWSPTMEVLTPNNEELGARMGILCAFMAIGGLIGSPISGALLGNSYKWWKPALFNGIVGALGCFLAVGMRLTIDKQRFRGISITDP